MKVGESILPSGIDRWQAGGKKEATVLCAQNWTSGGNETGPALPSCRTRPRGIGETEEGIFPSQQSPMAWRKMVLHLSVILLRAGGIVRGREGGLAR